MFKCNDCNNVDTYIDELNICHTCYVKKYTKETVGK